MSVGAHADAREDRHDRRRRRSSAASPASPHPVPPHGARDYRRGPRGSPAGRGRASRRCSSTPTAPSSTLDDPAARLGALLAAEGHPHPPDARARGPGARRSPTTARHHDAGRDARVARGPAARVRGRPCRGARRRRPAARRAWPRSSSTRLRFELLPDALPALDALAAAGLRLGVVSNWDCGLRGGPRRRSAWPTASQAVAASAVVGAGKPDPAIFAARPRRPRGAAPARAAPLRRPARTSTARARAAAGVRAVLIDRVGRASGRALPAHPLPRWSSAASIGCETVETQPRRTVLAPSFRCMFRPPGRLRPANGTAVMLAISLMTLRAHASARPRRLARCARHRAPAGARDPGAGRRRGVDRRAPPPSPTRRAAQAQDPAAGPAQAPTEPAAAPTSRRHPPASPTPAAAPRPRPRRDDDSAAAAGRVRARPRAGSDPGHAARPARRRRAPPRPPTPAPPRATALERHRAGHADPAPRGRRARAGRSRHSAAGRAAAGRRSAPSGADTHASDDPRRAARPRRDASRSSPLWCLPRPCRGQVDCAPGRARREPAGVVAVPTSSLGGPTTPVLITPAWPRPSADPGGPLADKTIQAPASPARSASSGPRPARRRAPTRRAAGRAGLRPVAADTTSPFAGPPGGPGRARPGGLLACWRCWPATSFRAAAACRSRAPCSCSSCSGDPRLRPGPAPGLRGAPCTCGACCAPSAGHGLAVRRPG